MNIFKVCKKIGGYSSKGRTAVCGIASPSSSLGILPG